jgi:hypothetical protein
MPEHPGSTESGHSRWTVAAPFMDGGFHNSGMSLAGDLGQRLSKVNIFESQ